jgi:hypothetical protein
MEHILFLIITFALFSLVLWADRGRKKDYAVLSAVGLATAIVFENLTTFLGFWVYHSEPKIMLISLYTWLLYIPYLGFCYFIGKRFGGDGK